MYEKMDSNGEIDGLRRRGEMLTEERKKRKVDLAVRAEAIVARPKRVRKRFCCWVKVVYGVS